MPRPAWKRTGAAARRRCATISSTTACGQPERVAARVQLDPARARLQAAPRLVHRARRLRVDAAERLEAAAGARRTRRRTASLAARVAVGLVHREEQRALAARRRRAPSRMSCGVGLGSRRGRCGRCACARRTSAVPSAAPVALAAGAGGRTRRAGRPGRHGLPRTARRARLRRRSQRRLADARPRARSRSLARPRRMRLLAVPSGTPDAPRDLVGGQAAPVGEHERLALGLGQRAERLAHRRGARSRARPSRPGGPRRAAPRWATTSLRRSRRAAGGLALAPEVQRAAAGHEAQVAAELAAARVELLRVAPDAQEDVLRDVLGLGGVCRGSAARRRSTPRWCSSYTRAKVAGSVRSMAGPFGERLLLAHSVEVPYTVC